MGSRGPIALLHEHPTWSRALLDRMATRGVDVRPVDVGDPDAVARTLDDAVGIERWINRINAMPSDGRPTSVVAAAGHLLLALDLRGQRVINGHHVWAIGASKAAQAELFRRAGLATPASAAVHEPAAIPEPADAIGYPVLVKPNVGGSGSGIARFDRGDELRAAVDAGAIDLGIDGTGLVQRLIEPADGLVHRIEMLGDDLFYATDQIARPGDFNYCAADGCAVDAIALVGPTSEVVAEARSIMAASGADVAGVEYLVDADGNRVYFDFNPYSNVLNNRDEELGFDPIDRYLDHVLR
ncbi:MAG: hypothetical protein AAGA93_20710 [Actinomycetota bacterium]